MTPEQFMSFASDELNSYQHTAEFKSRASAVVARQAAGEILSMQQIADALLIPLWLAELAMLRVIERTQARVIIPDSTAVN